MQQDMNSQVWRSLFTSGGGGGRGLENKQGQYKFVDGSRGLLLPHPPPPKKFKSRGSEMVFLTFSMV